MEISLYTHTNIDKCVENLKSTVNNKSWFSGNSAGSIGGKIKGYKFKLWKRQINYHNSLGSIFYGNLTVEGSGTRISGHFGLDPMVNGIIYVMYGVVILIGIVLYISTLTNLIPGTENHDYIPPFLYATPFIALFVIYGFVKILTWFGKTEEKYIIDFLQSTLKANKQK
jgi:hypothetical protein